MKHRPLLFLVLPLLLLAMGLFGARSWSGSGDVASADVGTGTPHLEIDLVKDGSDWCDPVDDADDRTVNAGVTYQVAICLSDATQAPGGFNLDLVYHNQLNACDDVDSGSTASLDDNPDANVGSTTFNGTSLGTGWNCNFGSIDPPRCDKAGDGSGRAYMQCGCSATGCGTLAVGAGTSAPIAVVSFRAISGGEDDLTLENVSIIDATEGQGEFVSCYFGQGPCNGATENKTGATAQPTATSTVAPTATIAPCGPGTNLPVCPTSTPTSRAQTKTPTPEATSTPGVTQPTTAPPPPPPPPSGGGQPSVTPPSTGTGSEGVTWATTLTWALGGGAALSLFLSGLYLRRVKNR
jgi:hypothetical protein